MVSSLYPLLRYSSLYWFAQAAGFASLGKSCREAGRRARCRQLARQRLKWARHDLRLARRFASARRESPCA